MLGQPNWGSAEATGGAIYVLSLTYVFTLLWCAAKSVVGWLAGHGGWLAVGGGLACSFQSRRHRRGFWWSIFSCYPEKSCVVVMS